jgi:hypothetical protein
MNIKLISWFVSDVNELGITIWEVWTVSDVNQLKGVIFPL